jgi:hypothetical protein
LAQGALGDTIHAVLCGAGRNLRPIINETNYLRGQPHLLKIRILQD